MKLKIEPINYLKGDLTIPGDKSITHRAIILSSLADGESIIEGFLNSEDCLHTLKAFKLMGVKIKKIGSESYNVKGNGLKGLKKPKKVIDCGNSGTCMRLLTGLMSAQEFYSVLTGDNSLSSRPMDRVIIPLSRMGAKIWAEDSKYAPLGIMGQRLTGINYNLPVASAQVKSSILLAGLYTDEEVIISEPGMSRDHSERMMRYFGIDIKVSNNKIKLPENKKQRLQASRIKIPGDISSASFFMAAAIIVSGSELIIRNVGINSTRSGIIDVIRKMEGNIELINKNIVNEEPIADIIIKSSKLKGVTIEGDIIPRLIDEIPIIAVLASQAEGETIIRDAGELRVKETDRIKAIVKELKKLNVDVKELKDGLIIKGPANIKGSLEIKSYWDHRIAMSMAVAGLIADSNLYINNAECIDTSFPEFINLLKILSN